MDGWTDGTMALDRSANGSRRARQKRRRAHTRARVRTNPIKIICTVVYRSAPAQALNMVCACSGNNPRLLRHRLSPAQASNGRLIDDSNGRPIDWLVGRPIRRPIRRRGGWWWCGVVVWWCAGTWWRVASRDGPLGYVLKQKKRGHRPVWPMSSRSFTIRTLASLPTRLAQRACGSETGGG